MVDNKITLAKKVVQCLWISMATMILLITLNNLLRPVYIKCLDENIELRVVATAEQDKNALSNNVRITHVECNGKDIDLSTVSINPELQWKYDSKNDFLFIYDAGKSETISFKLKNVHSYSITMVREEGSGRAELWVNDNLWESVDLYEKTTWDEISFSKDVCQLVFIEKHYLFLGILLVILFLIWLILFRFAWSEDRKNLLTEKALNIIASWHLGIVAIIFSVLIQYGNIQEALQYLNNQPQLFLKCIVLAFLLMEMLRHLTGRMCHAFLAISVFCIALPLISNIKLLNRGVPLLPWDFNMIAEALSVASGYEIPFKFIDVICCAIAVGLVVVLFILRKKDRKILFIYRLSSIVILAILVFFIRINFINAEIEANNTDYRVYQVDSYYAQRGFIPAFFEYCSYLNISNKPEYYSKETMESICNDVNSLNEINEENNKPNIIAIMDESFWDAERLDTVTFNEELLPHFNSLKSESISGELYTHVLSGGTVTSEFEFLTGFSGEFFPQDYMVYGSFMYNNFPSVVSILEEQGYSTTAIHPYLSTNYNRENAYEKFGFDKTIFDKDFKDPEMIRGYISDKSTFERIIEEYEENEENQNLQFIFTVTMQNHGGYWEEQINQRSEVSFSTNQYGEVAQGCMTDYFSGLHATDQALGELVDYFRNVDEDTIIIIFGDHMSDAGPKDDRMFAKTSWTESTLEYDYETHQVPFLVWSNFEQKEEDWGIMEIGQLLPSVFEEYGISKFYFWDFLLDLKEYYAASNDHLLVNNNGTYANASEMTSEQKSVHDIYELLQYDCIWGEKYASDLWELDAQSE